MKRSPTRKRQHKLPKLSDTWCCTVLYSIGDAVITTDRHGRIQQMNYVAQQLTGWSEQKAVGKALSTVFRIVNEQTRKKVQNPVTRVLKEGIVVGLANHTLLISRDGREIPIADSGAPILDEKGKIAGVVLVFRDQSAERSAQRAAQQARELAESIVQTVRVPLLVLDEQLTVVAANRSFYTTFKTLPEETIGVMLYRLGNGQWDIPQLRTLLEDILPSNSHFDNFIVEHSFEHIGMRTMLLNARRLQQEPQHSGLILLAIEDITERRRAEEARRTSDERFAYVSRLITDYAYAFRVLPDGSLEVEWLTESFTRVFGYTIEQISARGWQDVVHPDDVPIALQHARAVLGGQPDVCELRFRTSYGTTRWLRDVAVPIWDETHTNVVRIYGAAEDITDRKEAEQLLREREERLRTILEAEPECVKVLDRDGRLLQMNPAGLQMIEADNFDDVAGKNVLALVVPEHRAAFAALTQGAAQGTTGKLEFEIVGLKGTRRWLETHAVPLRDQQGEIIAVLGITRDITERRQAEDRIRQSEEQFRALAESSLTGIYLFQDNVFQYVNPAFERIFGYEPGQLVGKRLGPMDLTHPDDREIVRENIRRRETRDLRAIRYEFRGVKKDGTIICVEVHGSRIDHRGKPAIIGTLVDITERKRSEERIRQLNRIYAVLSDINQAIVRIKEPRRLFAEACRIAVEKGGLPFAWIGAYDAASNSIVVAAHAGASDEILEHLQLHLHDPSTAILPTVTAFREARTVVCNDVANDPRLAPWRDAALQRGFLALAAFPLLLHDKPIGTFTLYAKEAEYFTEEELQLLEELTMDIAFAVEAYQRDVERHQAEEALRESEEKFRTVAETAATAIFIYQGEFLRYVNHYSTTLTGYTESELLGMRFWDIVHPDHREMIRQRGLARQRGEHVPSRYEFKIVTKSGDERWLDFTAGVIQFQGKTAAVGTAFDITDRKRAEEAVRNSEERYRKFFEQDLTADFIVTPEGNLLMCNPVYVQMFGFASEAEAMNTNISQLWPSPEKHAELLKLVAREGVLRYHPIELRRRDGTPVYAIANIIGVFDDDRKLQQIQSYLFDDTPRKLLEEQLRQAQKMESLGTLAGGIAHDFNNLLGIILGYASMLEQSARNPDKVLQTVDAITKATQRGASLVKQLLTFARKSESVFESVLVNEVIGEVAKLLHGTFPKKIEIETVLQPNIPPIVADATQIHQVLLNLCVNARDAMPKGGKLVIVSSTVPLELVASTFPKATAREYVLVEVADSGEGMDEATRRRIFDPFFTTKGPGKGTGLGLALVYGIVETHNGFIDVASVPGEGSTFRIFLPIDDRFLIPVSESHQLLAEIPGGSETIFVVEDEEMLRDLVRMVLSAKGYTVITARDGQEGITLYTQHQNDIDLVICDLGMPKIGGEEVARRIRSTNPSARVVIASGFVDPAVRSELANLGNIHFMQKPYRPDTLLRAVRDILSAPL